MSLPHAVVIPFAVPEGAPGTAGLGLGLAALVHSFAQIGGHSVGLAQLFAATSPDAEPKPVEVFVAPQAWKDLEQRSLDRGTSGQAPRLVLTGNFEPPTSGPGILQLLAFDPKSGETRASGEVLLDSENAGGLVLSLFDHLFRQIEGDLGTVRDIEGLSWEVLESVLHAERCVVHDPSRGGPHDSMAALMHLGRAVLDAPNAVFPAGRLAALALDAVTSKPSDERLAHATLRTLVRAATDAPEQLALSEATAALELRMGLVSAAESRVRSLLERSDDRPRLHALLGAAHRMRSDFEGSRSVIAKARARFPKDAGLATEEGLLYFADGKQQLGAEVWLGVLREHGLSLSPFSQLAEFALKQGDAALASQLVDRVLEAHAASPLFLRPAIRLAETFEPKGLPRASRLVDLGRRLVEQTPGDIVAHLVLARALGQLGERENALAEISWVLTQGKGTPAAAEAARLAFAIREPEAASELDAVLRAAEEADVADLGTIGARAHKFAFTYEVWTAHYALGITEKRQGRSATALRCFEAAIAEASGATPAYLEASAAALASRQPLSAVKFAEGAIALEPENALGWATLAKAQLAARELARARESILRALAHAPNDASFLALQERILSAKPTWVERLRSTFQRGGRTR